MNETATPESPSTPPMMPNLPKSRGVLIAFGIASIILGMFMIMAAVFTTMISMVFFGILLIIIGFFQVCQTLVAGGSGGIWRVLMSLLYMIAGVCMLLHPAEAALWLTLVIAFMFIFGGIMRIAMGFQAGGETRSFLLFGGFLAIILGGIIWAQWPNDLWVIGTLIGIDVLFTGWMSVAAASALKAKESK